MSSQQVTAFLPRTIAEQLDEIRQRWDPAMARFIAPHITIASESRSWRTLQTVKLEP